MSKYALIKLGAIDGHRQFFKLVTNPVIESGKITSYKSCEYEEFCEQIKQEHSFSKQLDRLVSLMLLFADGKTLPRAQYNPNLGIEDATEFKTHDLRLYVFHQKKTGNVIVCGGKKKYSAARYFSSEVYN